MPVLIALHAHVHALRPAVTIIQHMNTIVQLMKYMQVHNAKQILLTRDLVFTSKSPHCG